MAVLVAGLAGVAGLLWWHGDTGATIGGRFTLTNGSGRIVTERSFDHRYMLVYFGYTHCADICPMTLADMVAAIGQLGARAARLVPVFITVDPARDTPAVMRRYTAAISPLLGGLTGAPAQIAAVARAYHAYYAKRRRGPGDYGPGKYHMDHSAIVYLMGPDGRFLAPIPGQAPPGVIARDIARLIP